MNIEQQIKSNLGRKFSKRHIDASIKHFLDAVNRYQQADWEGCVLKTGKFIEAIMKTLWIFCGQTLPPPRRFSVGNTADRLRGLTSHPDTIRILIPRACVFVYDIASNRGARHDPDEIDPNKMDASVVLPTASWILSELIRFADAGSSTPEQTLSIVETLMDKKYPYFENIDGRTYINLRGLAPKDVGLLILNATYPKRISRNKLLDLLKRHGYKDNPSAIALTRLKEFVDDCNGDWKLRGNGREEAEKILAKTKISK